ncbi:imidazole glycerol phosphate synthase subunit HisH [Prevotella sp. KH2C16]|uniref:imidazole glycerol phosphate synthase subunit HisH n=1 Tax=Prevotella sp. KH2C16 TaxID=1855325 RepID=UPI0008E22AF1|nr:imidazole glycerol phosphate synthase subunit HisH [Prevotella sp. KH2C16]SFF98919.1 glutamine amidotransferase [Prevotella sp. KH2C16]
MKVAIVKYNAGNIYSVENALRRIGVNPILTDKAEELMSADKVLFPGQGEASTTMAYIHEHRLDEIIRNLRQPVLGICIGQQLLCQHSEEGDTECIGVFPVTVKRFQPRRHEDKVPAMGWNRLNIREEDDEAGKGLLTNLGTNPYVYFVHSFYVPLCEWTTAEADYILPYSATLHKENFYSTQFHPEKSGKVGEQILKNFLDL